MGFFEDLGVRCKVEDERVYPAGDQASAVLDVLRLECERLHVEENCNFEVRSLRLFGDGMMVVGRDGTVVHAKRVIIAAGGCASPALGSNGSGFDILGELGHTLSPVYPVLTPIKTRTDDIRPLKGIRFTGGAAVSVGGEIVAHESGEILFTEYGLSGIAVFNLSSVTGAAFAMGRRDVEIVLDLMEDTSETDCAKLLFARARTLALRPLEHFFTGLFNKRIGVAVLKAANVPMEARACADLTPAELKRIVSLVKGWRIPAVANMGFSSAQATAGGVSTAEFDPDTLASKIAPHVYAAGRGARRAWRLRRVQPAVGMGNRLSRGRSGCVVVGVMLFLETPSPNLCQRDEIPLESQLKNLLI